MNTNIICSQCGEPLRANYRDPKVNNVGDVESIELFVHPCQNENCRVMSAKRCYRNKRGE